MSNGGRSEASFSAPQHADQLCVYIGAAEDEQPRRRRVNITGFAANFGFIETSDLCGALPGKPLVAFHSLERAASTPGV